MGRWLYLVIFCVVSFPLLAKISVQPQRFVQAEKFYNHFETFTPEKGAALVIFDFGPGSQSENLPQSELVLEHLFRKKIPVILFSIYYQAGPFLDSIPQTVVTRLAKEGITPVYGVDWVNLGVRFQPNLLYQGIANSENIGEFLKADSKGEILAGMEIFKKVKTITDIQLVTQITSLVGTFETIVQYFVKKDTPRPKLFHGCTSVTIPKGYIYLDSGQLTGLLEGVAGAAWYSHLLSNKYQGRSIDQSVVINTALGFAQVCVLLTIILGNIIMVVKRYG